jgi:hypothetical protein
MTWSNLKKNKNKKGALKSAFVDEKTEKERVEQEYKMRLCLLWLFQQRKTNGSSIGFFGHDS